MVFKGRQDKIGPSQEHLDLSLSLEDVAVMCCCDADADADAELVGRG